MPLIGTALGRTASWVWNVGLGCMMAWIVTFAIGFGSGVAGLRERGEGIARSEHARFNVRWGQVSGGWR